jgi:hypothetical protein
VISWLGEKLREERDPKAWREAPRRKRSKGSERSSEKRPSTEEI